MTTESTERRRDGVRTWVFATSVGLGLFAAGAVYLGWGGLSGDRIRWGAGDDAAEVEPVAVDDEPDETPVATTARKPKTILASLASDQGVSRPAPVPVPCDEALPTMAETIERAKQEIAACRDRYQSIKDYTCVFHKRERIDGQLVAPHIMTMKARTRSNSIYFKFQQPNRGREAIFVPEKHAGKIVAHEPGVLRMIAGTMILDPRGTMAMEENRHPITEAGIGSLIHTVIDRWNAELDPTESIVEIHPHAKVGHRACTMIDTTHPAKSPSFLFHRVKVYIDHEHGIPIRFEAYDWPKAPGEKPELVEEYTYSDLKTDIGLTDLDFDPANPHYSYGRF
jgi:hypothetical protein